VSGRSLLDVVFSEGSHSIQVISGEVSGLFPEILVNYNESVRVSETAIFNASESLDFGRIISYEWSFGDGFSGSGQTISHAYAKTGNYSVVVNVTDNAGRTSSKLLSVQVLGSGGVVTLPDLVRALLLVVGLILMGLFVFLLAKRRHKDVGGSLSILAVPELEISATSTIFVLEVNRLLPCV
jgi:hypothetical protein